MLIREGDAAQRSAAYGELPSWLPEAKIATGRILRASSSQPRLAIEGDSVSVQLTHGSVLATIVGPDVPETGQFPVPATSPCTFTVTLSHVRGTVPLQAAAFTILDELGHVHHPRVTVAGRPAIPARARPGQTVTLIVSSVLPTGGGRVRWAPGGGRAIASWDFDVEID